MSASADLCGHAGMRVRATWGGGMSEAAYRRLLRLLFAPRPADAAERSDGPGEAA